MNDKRPPTQAEKDVICKSIIRHEIPLFLSAASGASLLSTLMKGDHDPAPSAQGVTWGLRSHPFDRQKVKELKLINPYHANCITTKVASTIGLGWLSEEERNARNNQEQNKLTPMSAGLQMQAHQALALDLSGGSWKRSKVDDILDPLCEMSWAETLSKACEDYWECGEGYIEIDRARPGNYGLGPITGIHHIPAETIWLMIEDDLYNRHYQVINGEGAGFQRCFAVFGDAAGLASRSTSNGRGFQIVGTPTAEVIVIRRPSSHVRHYGFPDWLSASPSIELMQCLEQWQYDFFKNRGVPELMLWVLGTKLSPGDWKQVTDMLNGGVGLGNTHKTFAINIADANENTKIQVDKLGMEGKEDKSVDNKESYSLAIVSAHGVPPLLAGIQIPGKLGATNELPNALRGFQALRIGPAQRIFQQRLGNTLGSKLLNGGLDLSIDDFTPRRITDEIDLAKMDTSTQMRQTEGAAAASGRNMSAGVKN